MAMSKLRMQHQKDRPKTGETCCACCTHFNRGIPLFLKAYGAEAKWRPSSVSPKSAIDSYIKGRRKPCDQKDIILSTGLQGTNRHIIVKAHNSSKGLPLRM